MKKAAITRRHILQQAFELIYTKGYQATSVDDIIATTAVTKGAFYYHFKNKDEMGLAIISEVLKPVLTEGFVAPFHKGGDPLKIIYDMMHGLLLKNEFLKPEYGCPAANLTQELSPWHHDFSKALDELSGQWQQMMTGALEQGKQTGMVRKEVNAKQVTLFVMSGYWGVRNLGKLGNSRSVYQAYLRELKNYLAMLR